MNFKRKAIAIAAIVLMELLALFIRGSLRVHSLSRMPRISARGSVLIRRAT